MALGAATSCAACGPVKRRVRQTPAAAPRINTEFLRIIGEPFRCQWRPYGPGNKPCSSVRPIAHDTFLVSLRPLCQFRAPGAEAAPGCRGTERPFHPREL